MLLPLPSPERVYRAVDIIEQLAGHLRRNRHGRRPYDATRLSEARAGYPSLTLGPRLWLTIQKPSKYDGLDSFSMQTSRRVDMVMHGGTRSKKARSGRLRMTHAYESLCACSYLTTLLRSGRRIHSECGLHGLSRVRGAHRWHSSTHIYCKKPAKSPSLGSMPR